MTTYPYEEGDTIVLGPQVIASKSGKVINWKGAHYTRVDNYFTDGDRVRWNEHVGQVMFITEGLAENRVVKFRPDDGPYDFIVSMDELEAA